LDMSSRRNLCHLSAIAAAGSWTASSYAAIMGSNDRVRTAIIGAGDRMKSSLIPAFQANAQKMNFEFVAVSDLWTRRRDEPVEYVQKLSGKKIETCRNNEEL